MERDSHTDEEIKQVFSLKKIAVIGMSKHSAKAAHFVPKYLSEQGFDITPINPNATEILGKKSYPMYRHWTILLMWWIFLDHQKMYYHLLKTQLKRSQK